MEDRVEDGDALRVVEVAHRIVAAVDAPDQRGPAVAQRQQRGRAVAREALVGDAAGAGPSAAGGSKVAMPTHAVWP